MYSELSRLICIEVILGLLFVTFFNSFTVLGAHVIVFLRFVFPFDVGGP